MYYHKKNGEHIQLFRSRYVSWKFFEITNTRGTSVSLWFTASSLGFHLGIHYWSFVYVHSDVEQVRDIFVATNGRKIEDCARIESER